jgi:hypothetical protein
MCCVDARDVSAPSKRSSMQTALRARDAGLTKIATATRVLVAGAVAATGLFTVLAARAQPGRTKAATSGAADQRAGAGSPANSGVGGVGLGAGADTNLSPPATLPAPDYQNSNPVVVSGAS